MIIWQRWGILIFFALAGGLLLSFAIIGNMDIEPAYTKASLQVAVGFFISAVLTFGLWLLRHFNIIDAPRDSVDGTRRRPRSSLFFIPLVAWPIIFLVLGVLGLVVGLAG